MSRNWGMFPMVIVVSVVGVAGQHETKPTGKAMMTDAQKIASAMSAAPPEIAKRATIMDWPDGPGR